MLNDKFLKPYSPQDTESKIYQLWEESGLFNPDICVEKGYTAPDAEPFSIVMPPPNVTGVLHMGHALMLTLEDIMIRYKRMCGFKTLWLPGTDHAAIATQSKVEKEMQKKEGKSRHDLGREELLNRVRIFAQESHDTIVSQVKAMGASADWSREAFTLDDKRNVAVNIMFKKMYDDGLIYRANRIVNWDPKGQTTISDDEIVYESRKAKLYTFKYSHDFPIAISTTRPETKFGDSAVAVHPEDSRYSDLIGKTFEVADFCGVPLSVKIIADESVEKDYGTGALGVTPAHSMIDAEMAKRHGLKEIQVINEYAKMTVGDDRIKGKKTTEARETVVDWLKEQGLLIDEKEVDQNVGTAERTGGIIEPLPKLQWFVAVDKEFTLPHSSIEGIDSGSKTTLKALMRKVVENNQIKIIPEYFNKTYFHWIDNLRDWCISRQIWYGHRVYAFYNMLDPQSGNGILHYQNGLIFDLFDSQPEIFGKMLQLYNEGIEKEIPTWGEFSGVRIINFTMARLLQKELNLSWEDIKKGAKLYSHNILSEQIIVPPPHQRLPDSYIQDEDTLDTWFSSGAWTFSTLGWPEKTRDLETFHPTSVLETGYDILFFWVARMILMSAYALGDVPFKTVYLHGIVRDAKGQKMSKSLGNALDPLEIAVKYGSDAARMALVYGTAPGTDSKISEDKIKGYKHFANKLWNITRFVLENTKDTALDPNFSAYSPLDLKLREERHNLLVQITKEMDEFVFHIASEKIYGYIWHEFADKIIEESKKIFAEGSEEEKTSRKQFLLHTLDKILRVLHPFMPFVTEEIWQTMGKEKLLMVESWPIVKE